MVDNALINGNKWDLIENVLYYIMLCYVMLCYDISVCFYMLLSM